MSTYPPFAPMNSPYPPPPPAPIKGPRLYSMFGAMFRAPFPHFNAPVCRDVARNWGGINFWYLFVLLLITWILAMVKLHMVVGSFARNDFPPFVKDFPPITVKGGHVTSPVEQPYFMKDPQTQKTFLALDTTGEINSMDDTDAMILITDQKAFVRQNGNNGEIRQYDLSKISYFFVDKARIIGWMNVAAQWMALGALPVVLIFSLVVRLIQMLIYGAIAMGFSSGLRANLTYGAAMRLSALAITPIVLADTVLMYTAITIPAWWLIGIVIELIFLFMAVKANAGEKPTMPHGFPVIPPPGGFAQQPMPQFQGQMAPPMPPPIYPGPPIRK